MPLIVFYQCFLVFMSFRLILVCKNISIDVAEVNTDNLYPLKREYNVQRSLNKNDYDSD